MTTEPDTQATAPHPPGATLHLGGDAWASPALEPLLLPVAYVTTYPGNPRRHDQDGITASIRDHGMYAAVVIQATAESTAPAPVIVGNGRLQALLDLGATHVPVISMDVPDDRARAIVARDNRTSDLSTNDDRLLLDLLAEFDGDEDLLALAGYVADDLEALHRAVRNEDFVPVSEVAAPINDLYALLADVPWVRNVTNTHARTKE